MDIYSWADNSFDSAPNYNTGFTQLLGVNPYIVSYDEWLKYNERLTLIKEFQLTAISIFRSSIDGKSNDILHWLLNETPDSLGYKYHKFLDDRHFTLPVFFRTDEVIIGKIVEIQCPGSLWGDLQLAFDYNCLMGNIKSCKSPGDIFGEQLSFILNQKPIIHHLLDNSSGPAGMRYFIEHTRPKCNYFGIDAEIVPAMCNFIRSHSFYGICADNEFQSRLKRIGDGVTYDLPPIVLFDQKATLVLPFWSKTRHYFSDEIRNIFQFTTPLLPDGIELVNGEKLSIEEFSKLPRSQRSYYLKYAGSNVAYNWGSKAVFRLSDCSSDSCYQMLRDRLNQFNNGQIWILQLESAQDDIVSYYTRDNVIEGKKIRAKFSGFYGPQGCLGVLAMHRHHNKVHGQRDTIISYMQPL